MSWNGKKMQAITQLLLQNAEGVSDTQMIIK